MRPVPHDLEPLLSGEHLPQRGFSYHAERWRGWSGHLEGNGPMLGALPPKLDRRTTARLVEGLLPGDVVGAFTVAMIWGHGSSGYGPYRTARVLTAARSPKGAPVSPDVRSRLGESVEVAREGGPVEGYRLLNNRPGKVAGLGPAFFTKWLYFITARGDAGSVSAAPVLDALVISWLASHGGRSLRAGYTDDYARYVETLRSWGAPHGLAPADVEERIFRLIRNDGE
jgi:hypothetical protein